ncbi:hypothetical protein SAMN05444274_10513 [Mariniphaga anaerophila]|uniref:Uncharacterized protein n=1 Tax=Mariniphaga anaerophila TaxID=1484053 RepID=A0A1M5B7Q5_9BACT|nr:hypothetical protein [Mariniphaga anaerophila]SHF38446.1 hypothetical protein SAMN05444274_10513 [Mariniphaga anaerophila]
MRLKRIYSIRILLLAVSALAVYGRAPGQSRSPKDWIDFGSSHVNKWMQVAPGTLGPNALPVPEMDYARVAGSSGVEAGIHSHFMIGDTAVNTWLSINWVVVPEKVEVRIWGFPSETCRMTNDIRDQRQIYYDDDGWTTHQGDLWISTRIQLLKNHRSLPDITLNYSFKNTTGLMRHGRYSDAGTTYFYVAIGKSFYPASGFLHEIRVAGLGGFYMWQTNKVEMAQDEGPLVEAGVQFRRNNLTLSNEIGGYFGYDVYEFIGVTGSNDPLVYRLNFLFGGKSVDYKAEFVTGLQDYHYKTFKAAIIYRFGKKELDP